MTLCCCGQGEIDGDFVQPESPLHKPLELCGGVMHMSALQMVGGEFQDEFNIQPIETQSIELPGCFGGGDRLFGGVCHDWPLHNARGGRQVKAAVVSALRGFSYRDPMTEICLVCDSLVTEMGQMPGAKLLFSDANQAIQGQETDFKS